uniref:FP protein C-terminal domain-containing protein n=1 Tax=Trichogramma kaykai TaxID=54128 RepID=A0ABD2X392_9HYME
MVMQFKQIVSRDSVLKLKKRSGELPASALVPGAVGSLRLYEMHSNFVHDLLRKARTTASERGYRHVWARDGVVCVRKSDGADVIELFSESDLESLL